MPGDIGRRHVAGDGDAIGQSEIADERLHARKVTLAGVSADDEAVDAGRERQGADEDVHALPGVEVTGVGGDGR